MRRGNACRVETFYPGFVLGEEPRRLKSTRNPDYILGEKDLFVDRAGAYSRIKCDLLRIAVLENLTQIIPLATRKLFKAIH